MQLSFFRSAVLLLVTSLLCFFNSVESVYILRFTTTDNGAIWSTGNTLGLSKRLNLNQAGVEDSIGAFSTIDLTQQVPTYPPGTTTDWRLNSSTAFLDVLPDSTVLYAELIWSGSYGFGGEITGNEPDLPIRLTTPQLITYPIASDPLTRQRAITPGFANSGNYVRSADVTAIIQASGGGAYTVGGVPATIARTDNTHNAAGWTLCIAYRHGETLTNNMSIFVGCEQASNQQNQAAQVSGFCVPPSGDISGTLFVSAIEGDANKTGDRLLFGPDLPLTNADAVFGGNNPINNFFASQINTIFTLFRNRNSLQFITDSGQLDTRGTFGTRNANPFTGVIHPADRQGYDITNVNISNQLSFNQTSAFILGTTQSDDYTINFAGIQIQVDAPILRSVKRVNGQTSIHSTVGSVVNFSVSISNIGTSNAFNAIFKDLLEPGLAFVTGSFKINGIVQPDPNLTTGFALGNLVVGQNVLIEFQALIVSYPLDSNNFVNFATTDYNFLPCLSIIPIPLTTRTNDVDITLPFPLPANITATKLVNQSTAIISAVGDIIEYTITLTNTGKASACNVIFQDDLQEGQTLIPGSFLVDDVVVPDPNLQQGVFIDCIEAGQTVDIFFRARIDRLPNTGNVFYNAALITYQTILTDMTLTLTTVTNVVTVTISALPPLPPPFFRGQITKCKYINKTTYQLRATWQPASPGVLFYRIYLENKVVAEISAMAPLVYEKCLRSKKSPKGYSITAVYPNNIESDHVKLRISKS